MLDARDALFGVDGVDDVHVVTNEDLRSQGKNLSAVVKSSQTDGSEVDRQGFRDQCFI